MPTLRAVSWTLLAVALAMAVGCGGGGETSTFPSKALYAVSSTTGTASRYALGSGVLTGDFVTGLEGPVDAAVLLGRLYVVEQGAHRLRAFDTADGRQVCSVDLGAEAVPERVLPYSRSVVYVSDSGRGAVLMVDPQEQTLVRQIPVGGTPGAMVQALNKIYVANPNYDSVMGTYGVGTVGVIGTGNHEVLNTVDVGPVPQALEADARGMVHVLAAGEGDSESSVYRINGRYDVVVGAPLALRGHAVDLGLGEDSRGYLPAVASASLGTPAGVIIYDWDAGALLWGGAYPIPAGSDPRYLVPLADRRIAVGNGSSGEVYLLDESLNSTLLMSFDREITRLAGE